MHRCRGSICAVQCNALNPNPLEASKGGTKVGRMKDPLYKDSYLGITPPTFILPFEAPELRNAGTSQQVRRLPAIRVVAGEKAERAQIGLKGSGSCCFPGFRV